MLFFPENMIDSGAEILPEMISDEFRNSDWFAFGAGLQKSENFVDETSDQIQNGKNENLKNENSETKNLQNENFKIILPTEDETFSTNKYELFVEGIAPENAAKIIVDGYELSQFSRGDKKWVFKISDRVGNRASKKYTARAFDLDGVKIAEDSISIEFTDLKNLRNEIQNAEIEEFEVSKNSKIKVSDDEFLVFAKPNSKTASIKIDDYALSLFEKGDEKFFYRIAERLKNRGEKGKTQKYKVAEFDSKNRKIAEWNFEIEFEKWMEFGDGI